MTQTIFFDMDGTIANLYAVKNWLPDLEAERTSPYEFAEPMLNMKKLTNLCQLLQKDGHSFGIVSWLSKEATTEYKNRIRLAKLHWLRKHFPLEFNAIHMVQYGTNKRFVCGSPNAILFDDEQRNCEQWISAKQDRVAINVKDNNEVIFDTLYRILNTR